jgi:hypothetical protein
MSGFQVGKIDWSGKRCSRIESSQAFLDKQRRNSMAIMLDDPLLDDIRLFRRWIEIVNAAHAKISPKSLRLVRQEQSPWCCMCGVRMPIQQSCSPE